MVLANNCTLKVKSPGNKTTIFTTFLIKVIFSPPSKISTLDAHTCIQYIHVHVQSCIMNFYLILWSMCQLNLIASQQTNFSKGNNFMPIIHALVVESTATHRLIHSYLSLKTVMLDHQWSFCIIKIIIRSTLLMSYFL